MLKKGYSMSDEAYAFVLYNNDSLDGVTNHMLKKHPEIEKYFSNYLERYCSSCMAPTHGKKPCPDCRIAQFCSPECLAKGGPLHKYECAAMTQCDDKEVRNDSIARLLGKIVGRRQIDGGIPTHHTTPDFHGIPHRKLGNLMPHIDRWRNDNDFKTTLTSYRKLFAPIDELNSATDDQLAHWFGVIMTNAYALYSEYEPWGTSNIGSGVFLNMSYFDHSCEPDMIWYTTGTTQTARIIRDVPPNKPLRELKFSYIAGSPTMANYAISFVEERQTFLQNYFCFKCECAICKDAVLDEKKRLSVSSKRMMIDTSKMCCKGASILTMPVDEKRSDHFKCVACGKVNKYPNYAEIIDFLRGQIKAIVALTDELTAADPTPVHVCKRGEKLLEETKGYLNINYNIHLMRLLEWLFFSYHRLAQPVVVHKSLRESNCIEINGIPPEVGYSAAKRAAAIGESIATMAVNYLPPYSNWLGFHYMRLGDLHESLQAIDDAIHWFGKAREVWVLRIGEECKIVKLIDENIRELKE